MNLNFSVVFNLFSFEIIWRCSCLVTIIWYNEYWTKILISFDLQPTLLILQTWHNRQWHNWALKQSSRNYKQTTNRIVSFQSILCNDSYEQFKLTPTMCLKTIYSFGVEVCNGSFTTNGKNNVAFEKNMKILPKQQFIIITS